MTLAEQIQNYVIQPPEMLSEELDFVAFLQEQVEMPS
jgi:hypothetical protein